MDDVGLEKFAEMMEEMANAPREEMGKRQPGEKCMYEKTVFEEIADTIEEDKIYDEEFNLKLRTLVKQYYPYCLGHEIRITWSKGSRDAWRGWKYDPECECVRCKQ